MTTFYDVHVFCCINERAQGHPRGSCGKARGEAICDAFKRELKPHDLGRVRANKSMCLDRCELGPCVLIYPEQAWYRIDDVDADVAEIVREHIVGGRSVDRLRIPDVPTPPEPAARAPKV